MTNEQRDELVDLIIKQHAEHNSPFSDVREAVNDVVTIIVTALNSMECKDDD